MNAQTNMNTYTKIVTGPPAKQYCCVSGSPMDYSDPHGYYYFFSPRHSPKPYIMCSLAYDMFDSYIVSHKFKKQIDSLPTESIRNRSVWIFVGDPNSGNTETKLLRLEDVEKRSQKEIQKFKEALIV